VAASRRKTVKPETAMLIFRRLLAEAPGLRADLEPLWHEARRQAGRLAAPPPG